MKNNYISRYYIGIILSVCCLTGFAQTKAHMAEFVNTPGFEAASIGVCVKDMSGREIASLNKKTALTPASTIKVVTTATALEALGENYRFRTVLTADDSHPRRIVVQGYGDPTLGSEFTNDSPDAFLDVWAEAILKSIGKGKAVDIEVDDSLYGYNGLSGKWLQEDLGNYYASGTYGISVFDNTYSLFFSTMDTSLPPRILKTSPEMRDIVFDNQLSTNTEGKDNGYISGEAFSNFRKITGDIPAKRKSFSIKGDIPDPGLYLGQALGNVLLKNKIEVNNITTFREKPAKAKKTTQKEIYTQYSPYLKDIVKIVNVRSNNHYTEHLIRAIGHAKKEASSAKPDCLSEGIAFTKKHWRQKGIETNSLFMYDGCGIAPSNKLSPELLCDILIYMQTKSRYKDSFVASLPQAGKEGTVKNFLKGTRLEGKVMVKSGSIADVQCFAGYYTEGNKKYAFAVMVNNYNSLRRNTVKAIEKLLLAIF